jgi:REP element-mobilizing transposase RayT
MNIVNRKTEPDRVDPGSPQGLLTPPNQDNRMPADPTFPLAYHITWGTYDTRLHGDDRGTVDREQNKPGDPIIGKDEDWQFMGTHLLRFPPRALTSDQRLHLESIISSICVRGNWKFLTTAAASDHVHTMVAAAVDGKDIRKWLKRWLSESLSKKWSLLPEQVWWSECGSVKWIWTEDYYYSVLNYINRQRTTSPNSKKSSKTSEPSASNKKLRASS